MNTTIMVTGGTGTLGSLVVPLLRERGASVRVLSRHEHEPEPGGGVDYVTCDLREGTGVGKNGIGKAGIEQTLGGVGTILHLAGGPKGDDVATANLMRAAKNTGVEHVVLISVIGADRMPLGYFTAKHGAEQAVADSGIPWTTVRVAQVDSLLLTIVKAMAKLPLLIDPGGLRAQPVDGRDVAERLVELTLGASAGLVPDLTGPAVYSLADLARDYLRSVGKRRPTLRLRIPGKAGRAYRDGANLSLTGATVGTRTWEDFLAGQTAEVQRVR